MCKTHNLINVIDWNKMQSSSPTNGEKNSLLAYLYVQKIGDVSLMVIQGRRQLEFRTPSQLQHTYQYPTNNVFSVLQWLYISENWGLKSIVNGKKYRCWLLLARFQEHSRISFVKGITDYFFRSPSIVINSPLFMYFLEVHEWRQAQHLKPSTCI